MTVSLDHVRFGKLKLTARPKADIKRAKEMTVNTVKSPLMKGIFNIIPISTDAKTAGDRTDRLTNILEANTVDAGTGKLFTIHRFLPSMETEAMVVQDVPIQNMIIGGKYFPIVPVICISPSILSRSMNGMAMAKSSRITIPKPVLST
jgi:hypothetical protein